MSNGMDFLSEFSSVGDGEDYPAAYLGEVGKIVKGTIVGTPRKAETKFGPRLIVDLTTIDGTNCSKGSRGADGPAEIGETLSLWIKPGNQAAAIKDAIQAAGADGLEEGGTLALKIVDQQDVGKGNPLNIHKAAYERPKAAVAVGDDLL